VVTYFIVWFVTFARMRNADFRERMEEKSEKRKYWLILSVENRRETGINDFGAHVRRF
jgi:hypothetical protein